MKKSQRCMASIARVEERSHWVAGISDKKKPTWEKRENLREIFFCNHKNGHKGPHLDLYKMVEWTSEAKETE